MMSSRFKWTARITCICYNDLRLCTSGRCLKIRPMRKAELTFKVSWLKNSKSSGSYYGFFLPAAFLLCLALLIGTAFVSKDHTEKSLKRGLDIIRGSKCPKITCEKPQIGYQKCLSQTQCRPPGSEALPKGLVANTSDLQMQPLWGPHKKVNSSMSLFTVAVGIKQKEMVDKMVSKFLSNDFSVILFHYDGVVDAWKDLEWANNVVHVSAVDQTKWWFAKRFLHPDIVSQYSYIFIWDEDLGVENFDPGRYMSIVKEEGLEISQPALDTKKSEVHHMITARWSNSIVHRRAHYKSGGRCDEKNENPPCTGWIELMAPVFSRAAWRCVWYMIQNDLNHAWGLDIQLGYCAQGDRTKNVGVVDAEYIVHSGLPTLGEPENKGKTNSSEPNVRLEVRRQSLREYKIFRRRWEVAAKEDESWADPYPGSLNYSIL